MKTKAASASTDNANPRREFLQIALASLSSVAFGSQLRAVEAPPGSSVQIEEGLEVGQRMPNLSLPDRSGKTRELHDMLKGQVVLIDVPL